MRKFGILLIMTALAPAPSAFAAASNPMSPSYNAVTKGHNETQRSDVRKAMQREPAAKPNMKSKAMQ